MSIAQSMTLRGRVALLTGATGGIGRVIAGTLGELGATLWLVDRPGSDFVAALERVRDRAPADVRTIECDLERGEDRRSLIETVSAEGGRLDVLVNNAAFVGTSGLEGWATDFAQQSVETWRRALEVNLTAPFELAQGLAPMLVRSGHGSIVNMASIYGLCGPDHSLYEGTHLGNPAAYAASKGGLVQLTRWLATTLAPQVRVNAIAPGGVLRGQPASFVERYEARTPLRRMASEEDFEGAIAFLATDLSRYVTGQVLAVDGGWTAW
jgi:NAD(P)-dependent dehydrogenase (short-subunit alcohol dehydrogenase family)